MANRETFHQILLEILGSSNVYYRPPTNIKMKYPCIVYDLLSFDTRYANNKPYSRNPRYKVTIIDPNPDSKIHMRVGELPMSSFDRAYVMDNLNHFVYNVYH